ncbi:UDP-glycosyltransferase UGT5-like [Condylostylus longicornis]|uniref:UDP-glycosyltransferase UGT5-like n=1 Tax=Condylostylus longicornis TaxID=2530218 RepID=UPI00244E0A18|nr:UDP-glycosyltransferase UGT5-like [Condylostylus longicornis]XP_055375680.1 UDP-glycosyltransferase UGT5-like [Condylostylus longicornis]
MAANFCINNIQKCLLLVIVFFSSLTNSYRILGIFPHPGISHFHFFHPIMRGLAENGHEVTVVSHFPDKSPPAHYRDLPLTGQKTLVNSVDLKWFENRRFYNHFLEFFLLYDWGKQACQTALYSDSIRDVLKFGKQDPYDIIIMEQFNTDCMMSVAHLLKAPVIALSSCALMPWHYDRIGNPGIPSYIPSLFLGQSEEMSFPYRLANWITFHGMKFLYNYYSHHTATELSRKRFDNDIPEISELVKETSLFFVNQHYSMGGAKPLSPAVIELGGIHIQKAKTLEADIQKFLDSAKEGVIYVSWGSMIRAETLPSEKRDGMLRAFGRLKQKVIWKWENETLHNQPKNILIRKWLPQREILCHPNVKVFMSHGGLMGASEAAYCGVPAVLTPMYGDQFLNSAAIRQREMGIVLNYEDITESSVYKAINEVLNRRYMDAAKAVSYSFKNRPQKALETAIWWVEHVGKTEGAPFTKSVSTFMPWYSYNCLDIYLFFIFMIISSIMSWIALTRIICGNRSASVEKAKRN